MTPFLATHWTFQEQNNYMVVVGHLDHYFVNCLYIYCDGISTINRLSYSFGDGSHMSFSCHIILLLT